ncbi:hypothetical protein B296_00013781 [Ensete ventricosum]|uniref:Uncharacterized protein n=1 Tax=Ensete ventricosum TaxID=4639 RepID=A0A426Z2G1_ENSVE|nr:hypothetical protein B296_00013781 [Ensete ventricosum]
MEGLDISLTFYDALNGYSLSCGHLVMCLLRSCFDLLDTMEDQGHVQLIKLGVCFTMHCCKEPGPLRGCKPVSSQEDPEEDGILAKGSGSLLNKIVPSEALVNGLQEEPYAHDVHLPIASPMMGLVEEVEGCRLFTPRRSTPSKEP